MTPRTRQIFIGVLIFLVVGLLVAVIISWAVLSTEHYDRWVKPGDEYKVGARVYRMPDLPIRMSHQKTGRKDQKILILSEAFMEEERDLMIRATTLLDELKIDYWLSGGTLIGFSGVFGTFIPWDDDIDVHSTWANREYLFSRKFATDAARHDLEVIQLPESTLHHATKEAAAVRLRRKGKDLPVCDIFFEKEMEDGRWAKVDSWFGDSLSFNKREQWNADDLFPLVHKEVDGMRLSFPNKPENLLKAQYGSTVKEEMVYTDPMLSHQFPYRFLFAFWKVRKPE